MDLLKSLNVEDLPEQQTRTSHLSGNNPDFNLRLGFDFCCACGKPSPKVGCDGCHRIKYCSKECRHKDSTPATDSEGDGDEQALGHTSVICALLALCNDDDDVEDGSTSESLDSIRKTAATDRLVSEFESYPATLANVISEAPCYQHMLRKRSGSSLTLHVVGASEESELWLSHPEPPERRRRFHCYADALAEISECYKLNSIVLQFFGPECPKENLCDRVLIPQGKGTKSTCSLHIRTFNCDYNQMLLGGADSSISKPDMLVFFNPGFTCPDYDWEGAVSVMRSTQIPFLVTSNTEIEGFADLQYLLDRNLIQDIPPGLRHILQNRDDSDQATDNSDDDGNDENAFFAMNPFCGIRVRQSGTMANDLYVKSRFMFGGVSGPSLASEGKERNMMSSSPKKKRRVERSGNTKKTNPALV
jgi:hypothetical protein